MVRILQGRETSFKLSRVGIWLRSDGIICLSNRTSERLTMLLIWPNGIHHRPYLQKGCSCKKIPFYSNMQHQVCRQTIIWSVLRCLNKERKRTFSRHVNSFSICFIPSTKLQIQLRCSFPFIIQRKCCQLVGWIQFLSEWILFKLHCSQRCTTEEICSA
jgi:hypothetical protein